MKTRLAKAIRRTLARGPLVSVLARCEDCGQEEWTALAEDAAAVKVDHRLSPGVHMDLAIVSAVGKPVLFIQLSGEQRSGEAIQAASRLGPVVVLSEVDLSRDLYRWRPRLQAGRVLRACACARARVLRPLLGDGGLTVSCTRKQFCAHPSPVADVLRECLRCDFLVAIRRSSDGRRDSELLCGFQPMRAGPHRIGRAGRLDTDRVVEPVALAAASET